MKKNTATEEKKSNETTKPKPKRKTPPKAPPSKAEKITQLKKGAILLIGFVLLGLLLAILGWLLISSEFSIEFNDSNTIARRAFRLIEWLTGEPITPPIKF